MEPAGTRPAGSSNDRVRSPVDALGHVFLSYNPGRYNGVVVLVPTETGFDELGTLPPSDDYAGRFYCAGAADLDRDGGYEIVKPTFCGCTAVCPPDARGDTYRWRGTDYVEQ